MAVKKGSLTSEAKPYSVPIFRTPPVVRFWTRLVVEGMLVE
jgi:hypothetical protein